jgi:hypothetical protein
METQNISNTPKTPVVKLVKRTNTGNAGKIKVRLMNRVDINGENGGIIRIPSLKMETRYTFTFVDLGGKTIIEVPRGKTPRLAMEYVDNFKINRVRYLRRIEWQRPACNTLLRIFQPNKWFWKKTNDELLECPKDQNIRVFINHLYFSGMGC